MKSKKIALLASILMATLVVGVYAGMRLSNIITASWTLKESKKNLVLYWDWTGYGKPTGEINRGNWIYASIGLNNTGDAPYNIIPKFKIWAGAALSKDNITIQYDEPGDGLGWIDMSGVLVQYDSYTVTGGFGPADGFTVPVGYVHVTDYRILFDGDAPLAGYSFEAWIEEAP